MGARADGTLGGYSPAGAGCDGATSGWNGVGDAADPHRLAFDGVDDYGDIAVVRVYAVALTPNEVRANCRAEAPRFGVACP